MRKLDANGAVLLTVTVGLSPQFPIFDGTNIWVPNIGDSSVSVVRASNGTILATLTGIGLAQPQTAAFDVQRILVTNNSNPSVSLWKAADLTTLGNFDLGATKIPYAACSDGIHFRIAAAPSQLFRF